MDKKNTAIGVLLLILAFGALYWGSRFSPPPPPAPEVAPPRPTGSGQPGPTITPTSPSDATFAALARDSDAARVTLLANDFVEVRLTNLGGAIRDVALRQYPASKDSPEPFVFNQLHADPILGFVDFPGLGRDTPFELVSATATEVVYRYVFENRIEVTRRYQLVPSQAGDTTPAPYQIRHETTFRNLTAQTSPLPRAALSLGTTALVSANDFGQHLNVGYYDGDKFHFTERSELEGGGFLAFFGFGSRAPKPFVELNGPLQWATVKNQFFTSVLTPDQPGLGVITRRVELPPFPGKTEPSIGVTGAARFELPTLAPEQSTTLAATLYVGPKEYKRLAQLDKDQDKVMQFDRYFFNRMLFSGYVGPFLLTLMNSAYQLVPNWGVAIVLMTIFLKVITLPFTLAASRSAKRMQKLQPQMQAIREKYKDTPQKLNQATMQLFKEHKVNPMGGCLPILITIPLFVGFFAMLQSASELRFAEFLWARDLSAPDTVWRVWGLPLNLMPLLMGATMILQMRLTPTPTTDNAQVMIFKLMPYVFTLICYNFSCALALYTTVGNVFTIGQQLIINRLSDKAADKPPAASSPAKTGGKPIKNVTPPKSSKPKKKG